LWQWKPIEPKRSAVHMREEVDLHPSAGQVAGNSTLVFNIPKHATYLTRVWLRPTFRSLTVNSPVENSTIVCRADGVGFTHFKEIRIRYSSQRLQTIHKEELALMHKHWLTDQETRGYDIACAFNQTIDQRPQDVEKDQTLKVPLYPLWLQWCDENALAIQALTHELSIEIDLEPAANWMQSNTAYTINGHTGSAITEADYYTAGDSGSAYALTVEYGHTTDDERMQMVSLYKDMDGVRYLMPEVQQAQPQVIAASVSLAAGVQPQTQTLQNLDMPTYCLFVMFRWVADLTRQAGTNAVGYTAVHGRDLFNVSGWANPITTNFNPSTPLVKYFEIKANQDVIWRAAPIQEFLYEHKARFFANGIGFETPVHSFSHDPLDRNATLGGIDFGELNCRQAVGLNTNPNGLSGSGSTIGGYALLDIGESSALQVDLFAFCYSAIDISNTDIEKPFH
jgi:hypothetical protein